MRVQGLGVSFWKFRFGVWGLYRVGVHVVLIRDRRVGTRADNRVLLVEGVRVRGALAHAVAGVGDMVQEGKNPKRRQGL